jgi:hypothetical protein
LSTDPEALPFLDPKGLRVWDTTVTGNLDLEECKVSVALDFRRCEFKGSINLDSARSQAVYFFDSSMLKGIRANGAVIEGSLFIRRVLVKGGIKLAGAEIKGNLNCAGSQLEGSEIALYANGARIHGDVVLCADERPGGRFRSSGQVSFYSAEIDGDLDCAGASIGADETALNASEARIGGAVLLLVHVHVQEDSRLWYMTLRTVHRFESVGTVRLDGAEIKGSLRCSGAKISEDPRHQTAETRAAFVALMADRIRVRGDVKLDRDKETNLGFEASGTIRLVIAEITGSVGFTGAKLTADGDALRADGAVIGDCLYLTGAEFTSPIHLPDAEIKKNLYCSDSAITSISCFNVQVGQDLVWRAMRDPERVGLDLTGARVGNLRDDKKSWPEEEHLDLNGLVYDQLTLHASPDTAQIDRPIHPRGVLLEVNERIEWLLRQGPGRIGEPQPWMQLRSVVKKRGDIEGAKHVLYRYRCVQARKSNLFVRRSRMAYAWLEENPTRILWPAIVTVLIFTCIFWNAGIRGAIAPTDKDAYQAFSSGEPLPSAYPKLNPVIYSLENAVPLVKFGQNDKWAPDPRYPSKSIFTNYWFLMWARWVLVLWGWFQAGVLSAAVLERFKPQ